MDGMYIFSLCIFLWSGGEDCSYSYVLTDEPTVTLMYHLKGGDLSKVDRILGFVDHVDKKIYLSYGMGANQVEHEIKHVICHLEYVNSGGIKHPDCLRIDNHFYKDTKFYV